jgi:hypothetical protein
VGCGLATYFWSWPKNTKRKVSRQEEKGGVGRKEGEGRERTSRRSKDLARTRGTYCRSKQQSESKEGRIIRWTSTNINEPVSDAGPPVVSMRIGVPKRPRKDGIVGEPRAQRGIRTILRGSLVKAVP